MNEKTLIVRFRHPLRDSVFELKLSADATFGEILSLLYKNGFIEKKTADYGFILNRRLCALNKSLASYVSPETTDAVDIEINGLLTIMS
jgi:hypothetical protein